MAKGDDKRRAEQQQTASWDSLNKLFSIGTSTAKTAGTKGFGLQDEAAKYFESLLGDRTARMEAAAPAVNAAREGADAAKREQAFTGTGRSGGAVAANQQLETNTRSQIDSLISSLGPNAAEALGNLGTNDIAAMLSALGVSSNASGALGEQSTGFLNEKNRASAAKWGALIGGIADIGSAAILA